MASFGILGPLTVHGDGGRSRPLDPRQTRVLAVLLLEANRTIPTRYLIDSVWDDKPPATARRQLQNVVSILRQQHGLSIHADGPGYRIAVHDGQLDAQVFADRVARARQLQDDGRSAEAVAELRQALAIWRGPALAGCGGQRIEASAGRLDEQRLAVTEQCLDLELALGRHELLVGELVELVAENPVRERLVGQLMQALHRSGRQADALAAYDKLRTRLATELGLDPGTELRELRTALLRNEPVRTGSTVERPEVPRQLPATAHHFVGRDAELKELSSRLDPASTGGTVTISALAGTAGIGKTTLALHWAHRVADEFPDGQLYVNLRGFDPTGPAMSAAEAVRGFLNALRVPATRIPAGIEAEAALYRSLVADRRMLVLLDNAGDVEQVRPLLPGGGRCLVLVTSRNDLTGLVAAEGAYPITLDVLTSAEARELLARHLGADRLTAEPAAVEAMVDSCAGLPLALAVVAARAVARPGFPLATLAAELTDARGRLDALDTGDRMTQVRAVFSWSYQRLGRPAATMFRRLGLHPGPDVNTHAAASLAGVPVPETRRALAELTRAHLVTEHTPGRYTMHDLLRAYAAELAHGHDPEPERRAAVDRMVDHYVATAHAAALLVSPLREAITVVTFEPGTSTEPLAGSDQALAWFDAEHRVLLGVIAQAAAGGGHDAHTWDLARSLRTILSRWGNWHDELEVQRLALTAAERIGDPQLQAHAHRSLGRVHTYLGQYDEARTYLERALVISEGTGDLPGQAGVNLATAIVYEQEGRFADALHHNQRAHDLYLALAHERGQADTLNAIGMCHNRLENYPEAIAYCRRALARYQTLGDRHGEAATWDSIAFAHHHLGDYPDAIACYRKAIELCLVVADRYHEADTLVRLGETLSATGDDSGARETWHHALRLLEDLGHPDAEVVRGKLSAHL